jgi:anaerobic magnesium-protoporphyrin IX monomethyl ester cyclase
MNPICLVIPPSPFLLDERVFMSLGLLRVAAVLEQEGVPVQMLDLSGIANFEEAFKAHAKESEASSFAFTATTPQMPQAARLASWLKAERPDVKRILGGPHPTLSYAAFKKEKAKGRSGS